MSGDIIASRRKELKLTQQQLAGLIHVSNKAISKREGNRGLPDISLIITLSEVLNITILELLKSEKVSDTDIVKINDIVKYEDEKAKYEKEYIIMFIAYILLMKTVFIKIKKMFL